MPHHLFKLTIFVVVWQKLVDVLGKILRSFFQFYSIILELWNSLPHFRRKLLRNVFIGLIVFWSMMMFKEYLWLMDAEDVEMDLAMRLQHVIPPINERKIPGFVFLDIDDDSLHKWNEPAIVPRDKIKNLIDAAVRGKAELIVVDYDLSRAILVEEGAPLHSGDQVIKDYLANYNEYCQANKSCPPILLIRTFQLLSDPMPRPRMSFVEEAVQQSAPYVQWGTVKFERSTYDQHVRRWRLWEVVCVENQPAVIPSIELLAAALIRNKYPLTEGIPALTPAQTHALLKKQLAQFQPKNCQGEKELAKLPSQIKIGDLSINTDKRGVHQRVMFSLSWLDHNQKPELPDFKHDQSSNTILTILSAHDYAELPVETDLEIVQKKLEIFQEQIVIIGSSSPQGRDIHLTPLGKMPGAMIVLNAIHSLLQYEMIKPMPLWVQLIGFVGLIIFMSWLFSLSNSFSNSFLGMLLSGGLIIFGLLPITIFFFRYGIWLDFALPLLVVQFYQMAADFEDLRKQCQVQIKKVPLNQ